MRPTVAGVRARAPVTPERNDAVNRARMRVASSVLPSGAIFGLLVAVWDRSWEDIGMLCATATRLGACSPWAELGVAVIGALLSIASRRLCEGQAGNATVLCFSDN